MAQSRRHTNYQLTFVVLAAGTAAYALMQSMVTPVLPTIQHDLHTTQNTVTWVLTAYLLSASVFTPILGRVGDMIGKERMFVLTLVALAAGSLIAALATTIGVMIVARVVQGIGGAVLPLSFGIIRDEFPEAKVATGVGVVAALTSVGSGLGIVLAGPIVDAFGWHWLFWLPLIATSVAAVGAYFFVPQSPVRTPGRVSLLAAVLLSGSLVALLIGVSEAPEWGWVSAKVLALFGLAVLAGIGWFVTEVTSAHPLIDMRMMRLPAVWTTNLVALLFGACLYSIFAFLPEFVQAPAAGGYGFTASISQSGLFLLPLATAMFALGVVSGRLSQYFGSKRVLLVGSVVGVAPFVMLAYLHGARWQVFLAMSIMGIGFGLAFSAISNLIVAAVTAEQTGVASGMNANIRTIGGAVGAAITGSVLTSSAHAGGAPSDHGWTLAFLILAILALGAALASALVPGAPRDPMTHHEKAAPLPHAELALLPGGTLFGDDPE